MADYELTINLLDKTINFPITILEDLKPFFAKIEATHTGVQKTNNALLTLYIPPDGKFVRTAPLFMDEDTKNKYMIEIQINQGANLGQKFRCEIGQPTAKSDKDLGEIIEIPLVAQEFVTKEHFDSFHDLFVAPADHFINIVKRYNLTAGSLGVVLNVTSPSVIDLPNQDVIKQNWLPLAPTKTGNLMEEVINRLALEPPAGGKLTDYYYDFTPNVSTLRIQDVFAEEFGDKDSGVVISPLTVGQVGAESGNTFNLDNLIYKNLVILKGDPNCGSLPREHQVFASKYLHALQRPVWSPGTTYNKGDGVQVVVVGFPNQRFFISNTDSNLGNNPTVSGTWDEDFSIDPTNPAFFTVTPWTSDFPNQEANINGKNNLPSGGYVGYMVDYNISRYNFDRVVPDDNYERISVKMIDFRLNGPPLSSFLWAGKRYICGIEGSDNGDMVGVFQGNRGKIAEFTGDPTNPSTHVWHFSDPPLDTGSGSSRQQDSVNYLPDATVLVWDDTANGGNGDWIEQWNVNSNLPGSIFAPSDAGKSAGSPFHPVKAFGLVEGATGIPDQAIQATYNWKTAQGGLAVLLSPNGNYRNLASRGSWLSFIFPYPRVGTATGPIGNMYGLDREHPYLSTGNLTRTSDGLVGWNLDDRAAEDLGAISSISFKLRLGQFRSQDDSELIDGFANEPMIFWAIDRADRVFVQEFTQRFNNAWEQHTIPVGARAPQSLYNSRIDELENIFGHILPNFNFFLPEREFNGVIFDWKFLKAFGVFQKSSYDDQGLYATVYDQWFANSIKTIEQALHKAGAWIQNFIFQKEQQPSLNFITDHTKIAMDELHFDKELYVTSSDVKVQNPRVILERDETQDDYEDARAKAEAIKARKTFFPQFWFITARGDVRMKLGQRFTLEGPRVPNAPLELVCSQVKHRIDTDGYMMEIFGIRKFEIPP